MVDNPIQRYSIGSLTNPGQGPVYGADGSLEIHLQHQPPVHEHLANWLPTPKGRFNLFLRTYLPGERVMDQSYIPPAVRRIPSH